MTLIDNIAVSLLNPIQSLFFKTNKFSIDVLENYFFLVGTENNNKQLIKERLDINNLIVKFKELELKNKRLLDLMGLKKDTYSEAITAEVIGSDINFSTKTFRINKGSINHIEKGMPVITKEGVVGHVFQVSSLYSDVILITDPNAAVDAMIQDTRTRGVIKGLGSQLCELRYLAPTDKISMGDIIITSGMGGFYPKGLPIGRISHISKETYRGQLFVEVQPFVDLRSVEEVLVLKKPTLDKLQEMIAQNQQVKTTDEPLELKELPK